MNAPPDLRKPASSMAPEAYRRSLSWRRWGWGVLITGWSVGALICLLVDPDRTAGASVDLLDARVYDYNVERMGGKAALFAVRFNQWLGGLWHGRSLGITVAVLALILALACFWLDGLLSERPVENGERDASDTKRGADRY